jgi:hypothetical protein
MSIVQISRRTAISDLYDLDRYVLIMSPFNSLLRYSWKHFALLDCAELEILEGYDDQGWLSVRVYSKEIERRGTLEKYLQMREEIQGFKFDLETDLFAQYFGKVKFDEESVEARWNEMYDARRIKPYHALGQTGWNCESLVFYILAGIPISLQGHYLSYDDDNKVTLNGAGIEGFWEGRLGSDPCRDIRKYYSLQALNKLYSV